jgi:molecular chaperone GrpE
MKKAKKDEEIKFTVGAEDLKNLKVEVDASEVEKQIAELTNDLQRTRADFENFRKQVEVQKENAKKMAQLATVYKILPLLDDLDRAIGSYKELAPLTKSLEKTLKELKLVKIASGEGTEFNPDLHDAVMVEGDGEKEIIAETLRPGYYYEGEILRPAMVKVRKI